MTSNAVKYDELAFGFGDKVRKLRRSLGMSQGEFARHVNATSAGSVAAWEAAINEPRHGVAIAKRIGLACGVNPLWLLGLSEDPRPGNGGPDGDGGNRITGEYPRLPGGRVIPLTAVKPLTLVGAAAA